MANSTGRPTTPLVLRPDERSYLEQQVRRHRVARLLSERCRIILRCAQGIPSKWTKSADEILSAVKRFCQKTQNTLCREL
jgi:hypothetical protein